MNRGNQSIVQLVFLILVILNLALYLYMYQDALLSITRGTITIGRIAEYKQDDHHTHILVEFTTNINQTKKIWFKISWDAYPYIQTNQPRILFYENESPHKASLVSQLNYPFFLFRSLYLLLAILVVTILYTIFIEKTTRRNIVVYTKSEIWVRYPTRIILVGLFRINMIPFLLSVILGVAIHLYEGILIRDAVQMTFSGLICGFFIVPILWIFSTNRVKYDKFLFYDKLIVNETEILEISEIELIAIEKDGIFGSNLYVKSRFTKKMIPLDFVASNIFMGKLLAHHLNVPFEKIQRPKHRLKKRRIKAKW